MASVSANNQGSTHHISLSDGKRTIGLNAVGMGRDPNPLTIARSPVDRNPLKTTSGTSSYTDFDYPYTVIAQDNWAGGRANDQYEKDTTRFGDSWGVTTDRTGQAFLGGRETHTPIRSANVNLPGSMTMTALIEQQRGLAARFISSAAYSAAEIALWVRRVGAPGTLTVQLRTDNSGMIGATVLQSATISAATMADTLSELWYFGITAQALANGTAYWVVVYGAASDNSDNHWRVGARGGYGTTYKSAALTSWTQSALDLYYAVVDNTAAADGKFFEYKGALYFVTKPSDLTASRVYINGDRGSADANTGTLTKLIDASKGWTASEFVGKVVVVISGPGSQEYQNWRTITANDSTSLTVDSAWLIEHTTATDYVILGADKWTEITGHGLTAPVTDVVVSNKNVIYFAQGDSTVIRRARFYNNAGTWTAEYLAEGTAKATYMALVNGSTGWEIWLGNNADANGDVSVTKGTPIAWSTTTNITWGTAQALGMNDERITALLAYVDANQAEVLWIMTEGAPWYVQSGVPVRLPLREFRTVKNTKNGRAAIVGNVYIYFSMGVGLERYYSGTLDDIGPNNGDGLPAKRQGRIVGMVAYPGRVMAAIDAGESGYSSVLSYNGSGWHEVYRAPLGKRIYSIAFQPVFGPAPDRLWVRQGADILYVPYPSETFDPTQDSSYPFRHEGALELSWMSAGLVDAYKYVRKVKLFSQGLSEGVTWLEADYKMDEEESWTPLGYVFEASPTDETQIGSRGVNGKRIKLRIRFYSTSAGLTPMLKAAILEAVTMTSTKFSYQLTALIREDEGGAETVKQLDEWAGTASPLAMRSTIPLFDDRQVFLMALPVAMEAVDYRAGGMEWAYRVQVIVQEA